MATIPEDYVSFETAKLLKEKGFQNICRSYWRSNNSFDFEHSKGFVSIEEVYLLRPTQQMAMRWLREVQGYIINIWYDGEFWLSECYSHKEFTLIGDDYTNYEDACEAAIKYCLENLI